MEQEPQTRRDEAMMEEREQEYRRLEKRQRKMKYAGKGDKGAKGAAVGADARAAEVDGAASDSESEPDEEGAGRGAGGAAGKGAEKTAERGGMRPGGTRDRPTVSVSAAGKGADRGSSAFPLSPNRAILRQRAWERQLEEAGYTSADMEALDPDPEARQSSASDETLAALRPLPADVWARVVRVVRELGKSQRFQSGLNSAPARNVWVVKPAGKSRGRGIQCLNRLGEILRNRAGSSVKVWGPNGRWARRTLCVAWSRSLAITGFPCVRDFGSTVFFPVVRAGLELRGAEVH